MTNFELTLNGFGIVLYVKLKQEKGVFQLFHQLGFLVEDREFIV